MDKPFYNRTIAELRESSYDRITEVEQANTRFFQLIASGVPASASILDLGTGNGYVLEQLATLYSDKQWSLTGIDISTDMLTIAKRRCSALAITFIEGNNYSLPFNGSSYNAITAKNVTQFSPQEAFRVLSRGGTFFLKEYGSGKGLREIAELFPERLVRSRSAELYVSDFQAAGFIDISVEEFNLSRSYRFEELLQILTMFPFIDDITDEIVDTIRSSFAGRDTLSITSDQLIIIARKP